MVNFIRPLEPVSETQDEKPEKKKSRDVKHSEEVDFVVRREHRRKHRQDRAL